jgi:hypothetical protein
MDGWTAFAKLTAHARSCPSSSSRHDRNQYKEAVRLGVDAFMEKPLNFHIVRAISLTSEDENRHVRRTNPRSSHGCSGPDCQPATSTAISGDKMNVPYGSSFHPPLNSIEHFEHRDGSVSLARFRPGRCQSSREFA